VAQRVAPSSRIVYVDNDPLVLLHARALLTSTSEGACAYIDGGLREPEAILTEAILTEAILTEAILTEAARTLDFARPVALMLLGVLHHIRDTGEARQIVQRLVAELAPGSYVAINHSTSAVSGAAMEEVVAHWNRVGSPSMTLRTRSRSPGFDGLELLPPWGCRAHAGAPSELGRCAARRGGRILRHRPQTVAHTRDVARPVLSGRQPCAVVR
jgi:S-adenosyl methyltransferase